MYKFIIAVLIVLASIFGLGYYKNSKIRDLLQKEISLHQDFQDKGIECRGLIKSDCSIKKPSYKGHLIAKELIIKGIDPTYIPKKGKFEEIDLNIELKSLQYSIWDLIPSIGTVPSLKEFIQKQKQDSNLFGKIRALSDGSSVRSLKLENMRVDDKLIPYSVELQLDGLDRSIVLSKFIIDFDLSKKRVLFDDYIEHLKSCCADNLPYDMKNKNKDELYKEFIGKIKRIDTGVRSLNEALLSLSDDSKKELLIDVDAKSSKPIKEMLIPFLMMGPKVVDNFYDIKVEAK